MIHREVSTEPPPMLSMSRIRDCICREVLDCVYIDMGKEKRVRK
jgi:hypothetical protein